jgi:hypothetical protein
MSPSACAIAQHHSSSACYGMYDTQAEAAQEASFSGVRSTGSLICSYIDSSSKVIALLMSSGRGEPPGDARAEWGAY